MGHKLGNLILNSIALYLTSMILAGIEISNFWVAVVAALLFGIVNTVIKPILLLLTLPINILSLGLFTLVINAVLFLIVGRLTPGFTVGSLFDALIGSIFVSVISTGLQLIIK